MDMGTTINSEGYLVTNGWTGMVLTDLGHVDFPAADPITRLNLMRRIRRSMTSAQYIAYCKSTELVSAVKCIADDKLPMTEVWYRNTIDPNVMGKVTARDGSMVEVTFTGGGVDRCTLAEFADSWEVR
jgi:hypothetical protein